MAGASLYDFRDLDLMLKLAEEGDDEGWIESDHMARTLGLPPDNGGTMAVAHRLSWMRRFGMIEYDRERHMWRLSEGGQRVTKARLRAAHSRTIEAIPDEAMVDVMAKVTQRYIHGEPMMAHLLRREFAYGTQPGLRR